MEDKICIKSLHPNELEALLSEMGQPKYRAKQIFKWLSLGVTDFEQMSDISKALRTQLEEHCFISKPEIVLKQSSRKDGTIKYLFGLSDGNKIETVVMQYEHGYSVCVSTQAGCKMGCVFCASYEKGATRNLTPAEILDQIIFAGLDSGEKISNIVLMGTGEPLDNYDNVMTFLRLVTDENGLNIGMRHISLSTCGIVPKIEALSKLKLQLTLSISLHAPFDDMRTRLMPINKTYGLRELIPACKRYFSATGRRISFEYAMISGVNDTPQCCDELVRLFRGFNCHINLIPLNNTPDGKLKPSGREAIKKFQNDLIRGGLNATVRRSLGSDIDAACGQLKRKAAEELR